MNDQVKHKNHHEMMIKDFKTRFFISSLLTLPILILSPTIQALFGFSFQLPGNQIILLILSTIIFIYGGTPFLVGLVRELKNKQPGMMTLIGVAICVAYTYSGAVALGLSGKLFFWELTTLIDVMLLGHWIEMKSVVGASAALSQLAKLMPSTAHLMQDDGNIIDVPITQLEVGNKILIRPGEKIAADGTITDGQSDVNQAALTGESKPISKNKGDKVIGGSINNTGSLTIQVTKTGEDSYLARVLSLVEKAQQSKSKMQDIANRAAQWLTILALSTGFITIIIWIMLDYEFVFALERMVSVMVITCPHALGLAIPLVVAGIATRAAQRGLLIRNKTAFEQSRKLDVILFDKTGTLTEGSFGVTDIVPFEKQTEESILQYAAALEINAKHSVAQAIVKKAQEEKLTLSSVKEFKTIPGKGITGKIDDNELFIGNQHILEFVSYDTLSVKKEIVEIASAGKTAVVITTTTAPLGIIALSDVIRPESRQACADLKKRGLKIAMITGDNTATAKHVAQELDLDLFFAEVLPDKKAEKVIELQQQGYTVAMVGDGINDAPALTQADVGIAIGGGTDIAIESADVVLVKNDPQDVVYIILLSGMAHRKMMQNLVWATGYNILTLPLAAGVLYSYGILLPPALGALIMSLSTVIVAINSKFLGKKKFN